MCITQLHFGGLQGEDQSIRSSYKFLGIISLFHLLLTIGVQIYSFQQKQRARQEWKLHRNLALQKYVDLYLRGKIETIVGNVMALTNRESTGITF